MKTLICLVLGLLCAVPGSAVLKPGCGFKILDDVSCRKDAKFGDDSSPRCAKGDLTKDPWAVNASRGRGIRDYPAFNDGKVKAAGEARWAFDSAKFGFWPLGGPVNEPWAESLPSFVAGLVWACENWATLPPQIKSLMGTPAEYDMIFHQREEYDLLFFGGGRRILNLIKAAQASGPPPPTGGTPPVTPPAETSVSWSVTPRIALVAQTTRFMATVPDGGRCQWRIGSSNFTACEVTTRFPEVGNVPFSLRVTVVTLGVTREIGNWSGTVKVVPGIAPDRFCPINVTCVEWWDPATKTHKRQQLQLVDEEAQRSTGQLVTVLTSEVKL